MIAVDYLQREFDYEVGTALMLGQCSAKRAAAYR
jgi:hypothetical protein